MSWPNETKTIGSFFHSCVSRSAERMKSLGCHVFPPGAVKVERPVILISASRAKVSIGLRRPPSWIATKPNCRKPSEPVSAAGISDCAEAKRPNKSKDRTAEKIARVFTAGIYGRAGLSTNGIRYKPAPERFRATDLSAELIEPSTFTSAKKLVASAKLPERFPQMVESLEFTNPSP